MSRFAFPRFLAHALSLHLTLASLGLSLASCASPGVEADEDEEDASSADDTTTRDAGKATKDAGTPSKATQDAGASKPATTTPSTPRDNGATVDAGGQSTLDASTDLLGGLGNVGANIDWDALLGADGGLSTPPGPASPDNPKECPETAPENPVGSCIGVPVYATCKYGNYTCLCDWIHWLCI